MQFCPYSPIEIPRSRNRIDRGKAALKGFWELVEEEDEGLSDAIGCYIFGIRAGKGLLPWYVGLAEKQSFRRECFAIHKLLHYNEAIHGRKGTPVLTLIAKLTNSERFAKPSSRGHQDIKFLETMLIGNCIRRNSSLMNIRHTKLLRELEVPGFLNSPRGRDHSSVADFKALIGT